MTLVESTGFLCRLADILTKRSFLNVFLNNNNPLNLKLNSFAAERRSCPFLGRRFFFYGHDNSSYSAIVCICCCCNFIRLIYVREIKKDRKRCGRTVVVVVV